MQNTLQNIKDKPTRNVSTCLLENATTYVKEKDYE